MWSGGILVLSQGKLKTEADPEYSGGIIWSIPASLITSWDPLEEAEGPGWGMIMDKGGIRVFCEYILMVNHAII